MPTPLVPRTAVLAALGAAAALTVACDRLPFVGPRGPTTDLEVAIVAPLGDTLTQLGIDVRAALSGIAQIHTLMSERVHPWAYDGWYGVDSVLTAAFVPGPGRHTFTVGTADSATSPAGSPRPRAAGAPRCGGAGSSPSCWRTRWTRAGGARRCC
jgi:hypothetical protein